MLTTHADIESRVISIIAKCTGRSPEELNPSRWQEPLTGQIFNLFPVDLIYILFEVEKEFSIQIPPKSLEHYGFGSIAGICSSVQEALEHI